MSSDRRQWLTLLTLICCLISAVLSLILALGSLRRQVDLSFEKIRSVDALTGLNTLDFEDVRCPAVLAEGESGTVRLTLRGSRLVAFENEIALGSCRETLSLPPGSRRTLTCTVRAPETSGSQYLVALLAGPPDGLRDSRVVCGVPVTHFPGLGGRPTLLLYFAPGALLLILGAGLWLRRGRPSGAGWITTGAGALLALGMLAGMALTVFGPRTDQGSRGEGLLFLSAVLLLALVVIGTILILLPRRASPSPPTG